MVCSRKYVFAVMLNTLAYFAFLLTPGKTKRSINRTLPKQHGVYDGSEFRWCISSICKIQKATVTYIPGEALYKKAFR